MDTLLHLGLCNAIMATAMSLPAALVGRFCRRPALTHGLWLLVLLKLLTPPFLPVPVFWLTLPSPPAAGARTAGSALDLDAPAAGLADTRALSADRSVARDPSAPVPAAQAGALLSIPPADQVREDHEGISLACAICLIWGAGSTLWFATLGWRVRRFHGLLRGARMAPAGIQERADWLAQRLGLVRSPGVWFVPGCVSPMLCALAGPPRLLLPDGLWSRLTIAQRDTLLAHELAHLRRWDHWVRWLEVFVVGLYWWHPVAWWAQRELQEAGEECCDAWVVAVLPGAADAYAEALLETVAYLSGARAAVPVGTSGAGQVHLLKRRLIMILNGTTPRALSPAGRWLVLAVGATLLPLWPTVAHSQVSGGREASRAADPAAASVEDEGRDEQLSQARAAVRDLSEELDRMRTRLDATARRLQDAQARLARLEGRSEPSHARFARPSADALPRPLPSTTTRMPAALEPPAAVARPAHAAAGQAQPATTAAPALVAPVPLRVASSDRPDRGRGEDYDQRLRAVEAKLDRLLEEFRTLRERQPSRRTDPGQR